MNHDAGFKAVRNTVIEYLLGPGRRTPPRQAEAAWTPAAQTVAA
jgi:hypothetical protein